MALTDFLKKKYQELTAPRLSQPRPNASQVVQNAIVNSIPVIGSLNSFMGRNNNGVNPNLNLGKVAQQFPSQVASVGRVGKIGTTYAQNLTNRTLKPLYDIPVAGGLLNSVINEPLNIAQRQADFFQNPNLKTGASYFGSGALFASNFAIPAVKLLPKQGLLAQVPNVLKQSSVKVGLPAAGGVALDTYGQGGSREDILRNAYQTYLMSTGLGVAFPVGGRAITNSIKGVNNVLTPKPQTSFLDSGIGGKGSPVTSTTRNALEKPLAVEPFKDEGKLSTTTLSKLEGKTTVKKQFIQDLTNAPDLKQNERELIRTVLDDYGDTVDVKDFAKKVKAELLPLKLAGDDFGSGSVGKMVIDKSRYESIVLPAEIRGNVANYKENIYESPIQTSAGNTHFGGKTDNYFGHTRIEDMADISPQQAIENALKTPGQIQPDITSKTRRVIEIQSDLYQKGGLERELERDFMELSKNGRLAESDSRPEFNRLVFKLRNNTITELEKVRLGKLNDVLVAQEKGLIGKRTAKLQQYNDPTAHFRMIREEVKRAAEDGKTKLQFPTGETAMEIEGLVQGDKNFLHYENSTYLTPFDLNIGQKFNDQRYGRHGSGNFIITERTGDRTFKAINLDGAPEILNEYAYDVDPIEYKKALEQHIKKNKGLIETFSIADEMDRENPIYKFYEKEVGKYLKNKYNAELVTDAQGVTWWEVDLKGKGFESKPVTAFLETKKPSDPLTQEARKYKSAEEFIKAQGSPLYHGTDATFDNFDTKRFGQNDEGFLGRGVYLSSEKDIAKDYGKNLVRARAKLDNPLVIDDPYAFGGVHPDLIKNRLGLSKNATPEAISKTLAEKGYDGVVINKVFDNGDKIEGIETLVVDPTKLHTKQQLTDIYIQATQPKVKDSVANPLESLKAEARKYKSAEEFVRAKGSPLYHGSNKQDLLSIEKYGFDVNRSSKGKNTESPYALFTTREPNSIYVADGTKPVEFYPVEGIKILNQSSKKWAETMGRSRGSKESAEWAKKLKAEGYDLIESGNEQMVLSPEKFKTKSQLTDIWNKVNKPKTEQSFLEIKKPITINPLKSDAEKVGISESSLRRALPNLSRKPPATPQPPDKVVFREELNRVLGRQQSGELRAVQEAIPFTKVDSKEAEAIIDAIQDPKANIPTYAKYGDYIKNIRSKFDELFKEAEDTGMDIGYRENYLPQIWKETETEIAEKMASVRGGFKFKKERTIPTYAEGKSMGLTPKYTHPAELVEAWVRNFERAKSNFEFSQRLQQRGIIVPGDLVSPALPNYRAITAGGFPTSQNNIPFYAPKEIADAINTAFEIKESPRLLDITAKISSKAQDIGLSGGIPRTPINAFSVAQVIKEVTSGRIVSPVTSAFRATFGDFRKYVGKNADVIREIQEAGTPLRLNTSIRNFLDQSTGERIFGRSFNEAWNKNISEATFGKFMPMLQVEFYKDVKAQALKSGIGNDEAVKVANKALRNFYGLADMATDATRSKVTSDIWTTLVFAPRYRESMIRFWVNNAKAMKNPTALENRQNVKFVIGAVISAVAYDLLNRQFNDGRGILDNPPGKEDKLLIPLDDGRTIGVPFLSSIATLPRTAFKIGKNVVTGDFKQAGLETKALGSFAYKPLLDIIQNEDYFGNKVVADDSKNAVRDRFAYLTKAYAHPYMRELINAYGPDWLSTKSQRDVPTSQRFMQAMELPIRFYTTSGIKGSYYYKAKDDSLKKLSTKERELYDKLNAPSEVDDAGLPVYNIRSEMSNALDRLSNPKITAVETKIALDTARNTGEKPNPFYLLSPKQQETVLMLKTFYPGDKTKSEITNANKSWLEPYWKARDEFIGGLKAKGVIKENPSFNQRPQATPQLQSKLDYYNTLPSGTGARSSFIRSNADVEQFFNDSRNYTNSQRADLGLPLLAGYSGSSGGKKPKKLKAIKIKLPKIKTAKFKKPKKPKKLKAYSLKKIKSKKIKLRASLT